MTLSQGQKNFLKKIRPWAICIGVFAVLFFAPNLYLLFSSGRWNGRQAVCGTGGSAVPPSDLPYIALAQLVQDPARWNASGTVLTTGNLIYSKTRETFYLQDGILALPIDTSDCQGLDAFKDGETFAVVSGGVATDNGYEFLAANTIVETFPNWVINIVLVALLVGAGIVIGFLALLVNIAIMFFRWLFTLLGIRKPKSLAAETKETKDKTSTRAGIWSIILGLFAPIFWFNSFVVGAAMQVLLFVYAFRVLRRSMRKTAIVVMVLCVAGFIVMAFVSIGTGGLQPASTTSSATFSVSLMGKWMVGGAPRQAPLEIEPYASSTFGFSIHQPKGWVASSSAPAALIFVGPADGTVEGAPYQPKLDAAIIPEPSLAIFRSRRFRRCLLEILPAAI